MRYRLLSVLMWLLSCQCFVCMAGEGVEVSIVVPAQKGYKGKWDKPADGQAATRYLKAEASGNVKLGKDATGANELNAVPSEVSNTEQLARYKFDLTANQPNHAGRMSGTYTTNGGGGGGGPARKQNWDVSGATILVNLDIYNGMGGSKIPEEDEEKIGAATVANLNDTDGNGTVDNAQSPVPGEVDLMQLVINKPDPVTSGDVTLTKTANIKLWETSTKTGTEVTNLSFPVASLPKTLWVEAIDKSNTSGDITITMSYNGVTDTVKATAIWAEMTGYKRLSTDTLWKDAGNPLKTLFSDPKYSGAFGISFGPNNTTSVIAAMGVEFTVYPPGIGKSGNLANVKFDVTQQAKRNLWYYFNSGGDMLDSKTLSANDIANDESTYENNNDNTPKNNHIYWIDGPGEKVTNLPGVPWIVKIGRDLHDKSFHV